MLSHYAHFSPAIRAYFDDSRGSWPGKKLWAIDGDFEARDRGDQPDLGIGNGGADSGAGRIGGGRGDRGERGAGPGRADDGWNRRRCVRDLLGREEREADGIERVRSSAAWAVAEVSCRQGREDDAGFGDPQRDGAGRGGWMGEDAPEVRETAVEGIISAGDRLRAGGFSGDGGDRGVLVAGGEKVEGA